MTRFAKIAFLTLLLLVSCKKTTTSSNGSAVVKDKGVPMATASSNGSGVVEDKGFPTSISRMDGWHGMRIIKSKDVDYLECNAVFPQNFGQAKEERRLLTYIVSQHIQLSAQSDCSTTLMESNALDQLRLLATKKQDSKAAFTLLHSGSLEIPFNLDGALDEDYTESYLLPVLERYKNLSSVLDEKTEADISGDICGEVVWWQDVKNERAIKRVRLLVKKLASSGPKSLANKIQKACKSKNINGSDPLLSHK